MAANNFKVYGYRWVVLAVFMLINLVIQILWICYAPITGPAAAYYGVTDLQIGLLAMSFMLAFIPLSIPASWAIDTFGFHRGVSIGALLMGVFGLLRGLAGENYTTVLIATWGLAIAQPFLLNAWTKLPAKWFAVGERATVVGLVTLSNLLGTGIGMALTPVLVESLPIPTVQLIYGSLAAVSALLFVIFARSAPPTPPCPPEQDVRALMLDGLKHALKLRSFWFLLFIFFAGMGVFNGLTTWIENIIRPRGFSPTDAGTLGAVLLFAGLLGAVIIPPFSDRQRKRKPYLLLGLLGAIPGVAGLAFATSFWALLVSAFILGFFLTSLSPVGMQYAAEITQPTPEGTSNGLLQLFAQGSVIFVYIMEALKSANGAFTPSLLLAIGLMLLSALAVTQLKEIDG